MAENFKYYDRLRDTLYRFACGQWPRPGQEFQWRSRDEVKQALKWLDQLGRMQEEIEQQTEPKPRRKIRTNTADVVALPPRLNS